MSTGNGRVEIIDSSQFLQSVEEMSCDVCIVGAGAAGLYLCTQLARAGLSVVVLEAGGRICKSGASVGIEACLPNTDYRGSTDGRFFGLGGSTSHWGGLIISHSDLDIRPNQSDRFDPWRHIVSKVNENQQAVATELRIDPERNYAEVARRYMRSKHAHLEERGITTLAAEFLPLRKKNLSFLLDQSSRFKGVLKIVLGAMACEWKCVNAPTSSVAVASVMARVAERSLKVVAKQFVLAAGTIESSRILLEIREGSNLGTCIGSPAVGRYLSDHLSWAVGRVRNEDRGLCVKQFAPRFRHGRMRSFRFYNSRPAPDAPRSFFHFIFENENPGFIVAKKIFGSLQARRLDDFGLGELVRGGAGLCALGFQRFIRSRLYMDRNTPSRLQLDLEQVPNPKNRIKLIDQKDAFGRRVVEIDWDIRTQDYYNIDNAARDFLVVWPGSAFGLPNIVDSRSEALRSSKPHDAYHPVGTCCLGVDEEAVVSPELRVHGTDNLYVLSTAVFPTAGTANPTFSMLCLGHALASSLIRKSVV